MYSLRSKLIDSVTVLYTLSLSLSLWLYSPLDLSLFFSFLILYRVGMTPWTGDQPIARLLPTHRATQTQNKCTQTSMPWIGFEPTTPVFERAKTVHALDSAATVIGSFVYYKTLLWHTTLCQLQLFRSMCVSSKLLWRWVCTNSTLSQLRY
jgi:hypothetical protein